MELVDRYLHAVRGFLPKRDQDDIIRELAEDIHSQLDDREAELGRPLLPAEGEAVLKKLGHPMVLAARFRPQQHLIGSAIFPFYWITLKMALGIALVVQVVVAAVLLAGGRPAHEVVGALWSFPTTSAISVFGWVTIVFAAGQFSVARLHVFDDWQPRTLPEVKPGAPPVSRLHSLFEILVHAVTLLWLLALPHSPALVLGPAAAFLEFTPSAGRFYIPLVVVVAAWMIGPVTTLVRPDLTRVHLISRALVNASTVLLCGLLMDAGPWVTSRAMGDPRTFAGVVEVVNATTRIGLVVTAMIAAAEMLRYAYRAWKGPRQPSSR